MIWRVQKYNPTTRVKENIKDFERLNEALSFVKQNYKWKGHEKIGDEHYFYLTKYGDDEIDIFRVQ